MKLADKQELEQLSFLKSRVEQLGFFDHHQKSMDKGEFISAIENLYPKNGEIWALKDKDYYAKIVAIAYGNDNSEDAINVIYSICEENGIYKSIRQWMGGSLGGEVIIRQPFMLSLEKFMNQFKLYKTNN